MTTAAQLRARRQATNRAARRRRRVLLLLLLANVAVVAVATAQVIDWWWVAAPGRSARRLAGRLPADGPARARLAAVGRRAGRRRVEAIVDETAERPAVALDEADTDTFAAVAADPDLWDPVPVTLPTYVGKPTAQRTVRTIDLDATGVWTSGPQRGRQQARPRRRAGRARRTARAPGARAATAPSAPDGSLTIVGACPVPTAVSSSRAVPSPLDEAYITRSGCRCRRCSPAATSRSPASPVSTSSTRARGVRSASAAPSTSPTAAPCSRRSPGATSPTPSATTSPTCAAPCRPWPSASRALRLREGRHRHPRHLVLGHPPQGPPGLDPDAGLRPDVAGYARQALEQLERSLV